jgi:penicillin-binding protein 1A
MREIHQGLPLKDFVRPSTGIIDVTVCAKSGLLKTPACNEGDVTLPFLEGTQPTEYCNIHGNASYSSSTALNTMRSDTLGLDEDILLGSLTMPSLNLDLLPEPPRSQGQPSNSRNPGSRRINTPGSGSPNTSPSRTIPSNRGRAVPSAPGPVPLPPNSNPFLDDENELFPSETNFPEQTGADMTKDAGSVPETENSAGSGHGLELPAYNPLLD